MANDTLASEEESQAQRRIILSAIILAIIVAAILWYVFVLRKPSEEVSEVSATPSALVSIETSPVAFAPFRDRAAEVTPQVNVSDNTNTPAATPQPVEPSAATGPGEFLLALTAAAALGGAFGLNQIRRSGR